MDEFSFFNKVDLHFDPSYDSMYSVVAVASEHCARGILAPMCSIEELTKIIKSDGSSDIIPIAEIDYPLGSLSLDGRAYCIQSAKQKGAQEVEITCPYHLVNRKEFKRVYEDLKNIVNISTKVGIRVKYLFDVNSCQYDPKTVEGICRVLKSVNIPIISTFSEFWSLGRDKSDNILRAREIKDKSEKIIKAELFNPSVEDFSSYIKAGVDLIGLDWLTAPKIVHEYEEMVQKKAMG